MVENAFETFLEWIGKHPDKRDIIAGSFCVSLPRPAVNYRIHRSVKCCCDLPESGFGLISSQLSEFDQVRHQYNPENSTGYGTSSISALVQQFRAF
jgi:hypothetical protein